MPLLFTLCYASVFWVEKQVPLCRAAVTYLIPASKPSIIGKLVLVFVFLCLLFPAINWQHKRSRVLAQGLDSFYFSPKLCFFLFLSGLSCLLCLPHGSVSTEPQKQHWEHWRLSPQTKQSLPCPRYQLLHHVMGILILGVLATHKIGRKWMIQVHLGIPSTLGSGAGL